MDKHDEIQNWTVAAIARLFTEPLLELVYRAATVHRENHDSRVVHLNKLISVKTGGCSEDCSYCPQAARYNTGVRKHKLMTVQQVAETAKQAKEKGVSRICLGAAWRQIRDDADFETVLEMVTAVSTLGLEVCCTLGMVTGPQAMRLKYAGLTAYNHNLDTSREFYPSIVRTRTYDDRLTTIHRIQDARISLCSGGIVGMGESIEDRVGLLFEWTRLNPQPQSVPINALIPIGGTPLAHCSKIDSWDLIRMVAATRIVLPKAVVRISAGRNELSSSEQALCFLAGASSLFYDDKLLTAANPTTAQDDALLETLGLKRNSKSREHEIDANRS